MKNQLSFPGGNGVAKDVLVFVGIVFFSSVIFFLKHPASDKIPLTDTLTGNGDLIRSETWNPDCNSNEAEPLNVETGLMNDRSIPVAIPTIVNENHRAVLPPVKFLSMKENVFQINADVGQMVSTERQTQIIVPPHAFLDRNGAVVTGDVKMNFKEYHNFMDIFLSGIPMKYDSGGDTRQFESAGMIEITAAMGKEQLYVNPESKITVMLSSMYQSDDYNLYFFDQEKNSWTYKGKDEVVKTTDQINRKPILDRSEEKDSIEKKFTYYPDKYKINLMCTSDMSPRRKFFLFAKEEPQSFDFRFINTSKGPKEMRYLTSVTWRFAGKNAMEVYNEVFNKRHPSGEYKITRDAWSNMKLLPAEDGLYTISLFSIDDSIAFDVYPSNITEVRKSAFQNRMNKLVEAQEKRLNNSYASFTKFQSDTSSYYKENGRWVYATKNKSGDVSTLALRSFALDGFGIWNCDQPKKMPTGAEVIANFTDEKGKSLRPQTVYLVDKRRNTVFSYYSSDFDHFKFNPRAENLVWAVLPGNKLAVIKPEAFKKYSSKLNGHCSFQMTLVENALTNMNDLKKELSF